MTDVEGNAAVFNQDMGIVIEKVMRWVVTVEVNIGAGFVEAPVGKPCCCSSKSQSQTSHLGGVDFRRVQVHWWCGVSIITIDTERNLIIENLLKRR